MLIVPVEQSNLIQAHPGNGQKLTCFEVLGNFDQPSISAFTRLRGGVIEPSLRLLAQKYNCDKMICR